MTSSIIDIFDDYGGVSQYRRVSARIGAFNEQFSPANGFRIESSMQDSLSLQPGVLSLLREVIASGKGPADIGLSDLEAGIVMVCTHRLIDGNGNVVRDASAAKPIRAYKDYEILETASLQRLMAKCGHGGDVFDDDEDRDISDQAQGNAPPANVTPLPVDAAATEDQKPAATPATATGSKPDADADAGDAPDAVDGNTDDENVVPTAMLRQIETLAGRLDQTPPEVHTLADAKKALKDLTGLAHSARVAAQA